MSKTPTQAKQGHKWQAHPDMHNQLGQNNNAFVEIKGEAQDNEPSDIHDNQSSAMDQVNSLLGENATLKRHNQKLEEQNGILQKSASKSEARLAQSESRLRLAKAQLEVRTEEFALEKLELTKKVDSYTSLYEKLQLDIGKLQDEIHNARRVLNTGEGIEVLKPSIEASEESEDPTKAALEEANQKCAQLESAYQAALSELDALKKPKLPDDVDDATLVDKWMQLDEKIWVLSMKFARAKTRLEQYTVDQDIFYRSTSSSVDTYVGNRTLARLFFCAVIWRVVAENVFANSSILLKKTSTKHTKKHFKGEIVNKMMHMLPQQHLKHSSMKRRNAFRTQLGGAVWMAIGLASIFARSKSMYSTIVHPWAPSGRETEAGPSMVRFDEEEMEMINQRREDMDFVEVTTRPGLIKTGNAKGKNYGQVITLVKAGVCC